jgi:hypothetical protein
MRQEVKQIQFGNGYELSFASDFYELSLKDVSDRSLHPTFVVKMALINNLFN